MSFQEHGIELKPLNYSEYLPINIIAYSYATPGAMGTPGRVQIISNEGKFFHFNYTRDAFKESDLDAICPPIKERKDDISKFEEEWEDINLGMGNSLTINKSISQKFQEKAKDINDPGALFSKWKQIVYEIIQNCKKIKL